MIVDRKVLLRELESVTPGFARRPIIEQSCWFVFKDGDVFTHNDEVSCRRRCCLKIEGAVHARPLLKVLKKSKGLTFKVQTLPEHLRLSNFHNKARIVRDPKISLAIDSVEEPKTWSPLGKEFLEAVSLTVDSVARATTNDALTYLHITPEKVEAGNDGELCRYRTATGLTESILIKPDVVTPIIQADVKKVSLTKDWIHFKDRSGLLISCRRYHEAFPDTSKIFEAKGNRLTLPVELIGAIERANLFAKRNYNHVLRGTVQCKIPTDQRVSIVLQENKVKVIGTSTIDEKLKGEYTEFVDVQYQGPPMCFKKDADWISRIVRRYTECQVTPERLIVRTPKLAHVFVVDGEE
ncbi:MAG: hypothetical protein JW993_18305 [Sedimentisphaerales bacterium]|nr:hypothetical protein [Sedimentisphaerales bacterium]